MLCLKSSLWWECRVCCQEDLYHTRVHLGQSVRLWPKVESSSKSSIASAKQRRGVCVCMNVSVCVVCTVGFGANSSQEIFLTLVSSGSYNVYIKYCVTLGVRPVLLSVPLPRYRAAQVR